MPRYLPAPPCRPEGHTGLGVLLLNLGSPDAPTPAALRRYLGEFLWDPRVVEMARLPWWLLLHGIILRTRPARSARLYRKVWTAEGSPLIATSQRQAAALAAALQGQLAAPVTVALAMRYGTPTIAAALDRLEQAGARRVVILPLYPQYSATTTASTFDAVTAELHRRRRLPELRFVNHYHDDPGYIAALAASVRDHWQAHGRAGRLLLSFHGIPRRYAEQGDPYPCECLESGRRLAEALGLAEGEWQVSFQSRFGREAWLTPYTDETLRRWGREGEAGVDVLCPGFAADCLETLEEIAEENRHRFLAAGGREFRYIPALNDRPDHIAALAALVRRHAAGWPEAEPGGRSGG